MAVGQGRGGQPPTLYLQEQASPPPEGEAKMNTR